ncbi:phospholipid-translocating P-type ATPase [Exidia glandulosa HHB12029]|uniref:Phospholipid-transporting ATPase n=1 Tax=Exidia glandulosa HHB12029 TaxID=1314781 RepID=A0A165KQX4_EXIGL|nr:phospholipid-translocating P-type ATPase [Exidia glandulosa HHB12029]
MYGEHDAYDPAEDPALRLRTVRTAASTIAESIRSEAARDDRRRRKDKGKKRSRFLGFGTARDTREDGIDVDGKKAPASGPRRLVHVAVPLGRDEVKRNGEPLTTYVRNKIRTSKYTPLTFLPKNLYEQFRRVANIYFLALVVLASEYTFRSLLPSVSARYRRGAGNAMTATGVGSPSAPSARTCAHLWPWRGLQRVAGTCTLPGRTRTEVNQQLAPNVSAVSPLLLPCTFGTHQRRVGLDLSNWMTSAQRFLRRGAQPMFGAAGSQISFLPLAVILTITAFKDGLEDYRRAAQDTELNNSPTTRLASDHNSHGGWRNVNWVVGLVVFTGADSKILLNGGDTPSKRSKIEKETNFNVVMNFIILIVLCVTTAVLSAVFDSQNGTSADFFEQGSDYTSSLVLNGLITFGTSLILFQNIVPISLYISIEIVKTIQAFFIFQDIDMYYPELDTPCVPKTWNISDDLGQIAYIFSDKTGTLTRNVMEFQKCAVRGVRYGEGVTEAQRGALVRRGEKGETHEEIEERLARGKEEMLHTMRGSFANRYLREDKLTLISPHLADDLTTEGPQREHLVNFFRALALCHTVLAERLDDAGEVLEYKAESPDEAALVAGARDAGFAFVEKAGGMLRIDVLGRGETYTPLRVLEFTSARKRMSVLVREPNGRVALYCKGADSVVYSRLATDHDQGVKEQTRADLDEFANEGLRTLCVARRYIGEEEYRDWERRYDAALAIVGEERDEEVEKVSDEVECGLEILGATALEDKLQEGVPEAIELLHQAGIKLWILTGDKVQTAIEIAFSCNLLTPSMDVMILAADTPESARAQIQAGLDRIASVRGIKSYTPAPDGILQTLPKREEEIAAAKAKGEKPGFAVVIDGDTLRYALDDRLKSLFLDLGTQCDTVVCCRVSPAQKALTVKLVKDGRNAMTLSIGDGANDVAMIQEANIGCGLFGHEGSQAAMSADYAFGQFRFLTKLLLVHGRWSYIRIAEMHGNFFYKNVVWTVAGFWFLFWNSFDATYLYEYTFILLYNLVFTSLPVIVLGAFDQDVNAKANMAFPQLYERGIYGREYTRAVFWSYMLDGLYQSAVVFFVPWVVYFFSIPASWNGKALDSLADFGTTVAVSAICTVNIYVGMNTKYWTGMTWFVVVGSCIVTFAWVGIYSLFPSIQFQDEVVVLFGNVQFWTTFALTVVVAIGPRYFIKFVQQAYFPIDRDIVREAWVMGDLKDRLGIAHRKDRKRRAMVDVEHQEMLGAVDPPSHTTTMDDGRGGYAPAALHSPAGYGRPQHFDMNVTRPSTDPYGIETHPGQELEMPRHHNRMQPSAMSYYSASDIPMSSPVRGPGRRLPSDGPSPSPTQMQYPPNSPLGPHAQSQPHNRNLSPYGPSPTSPYSPQPPSPSSYHSSYGAPQGPALGLHPGAPASPSQSSSQQHYQQQRSPQLGPTAAGPPSSWRQADPRDVARPPSRLSSTNMSREGSFVTADEHWTQEDIDDDDDAHTVRAPGVRASQQSFQGGFAL